MFTSKKKKEQMMQAQILQEKQSAENRRVREIEARMNINRILTNMKKQLATLETLKQEYIKKARKEALSGNQQSYQLAKNCLKLCLSKQRFLDGMISHFEFSLQVSDMNKVIDEFVVGMSAVADQMKTISSTVDMAKAQQAYESALSNNENQYEALNAFMASTTSSLDTFNSVDENVTDDEIDRLISMEATNAEAPIDKEIDSKLAAIREKMSAD